MPTSRHPAIEVRDLTKRFGNFTAVDGINLTVSPGSIYAILGPNGAGKTTTVRMISTLLKPDAGMARVFGLDVVRDATAVRSLIGLTGQYASVDDDLTANENLRIFGQLHGLTRSAARTRSTELLEEFGLSEASGRALKNFSGGMRRRLDLAASLIASPPLIFLDEPTTGLDPRTRAQMWDTMRGLVANGSTVVLTTQYLEEADQLADRIAVIDHGTVVADGTADELKAMVGESSLVLTFVDAPTAAAAAQYVAKFGDHEPVVVDSIVTVPADDMDSLPELLAALRDADCTIESITVAKPTLDEVFLSITGGPRTSEDAA